MRVMSFSAVMVSSFERIMSNILLIISRSRGVYLCGASCCLSESCAYRPSMQSTILRMSPPLARSFCISSSAFIPLRGSSYFLNRLYARELS